MRVRYITEAPQKENIYGVKVGDIFMSEWGYDQTNVDFFQVIALSGTQSVRVREVVPKSLNRDYYANGTSANITYEMPDTILPPKSFSVFIKDQEHGDLKRVRQYGKIPLIDLRSFASAYLVTEKVITTTVDFSYR